MLLFFGIHIAGNHGNTHCDVAGIHKTTEPVQVFPHKTEMPRGVLCVKHWVCGLDINDKMGKIICREG